MKQIITNTRSYLMVIILVVTTSISIGEAVAAIDPNLPDLGEPYDVSISNADILDAIKRGSYNYAWSLAKDLLYQKARDKLMDKKTLTKIYTFIGKELEKLLNDPNKTDEQKADEIVELIIASIEPYEVQEIGDLKMSLKHSIEYGATLLSWDIKTVQFPCSAWHLSCTWEEDYNGFQFQNCEYTSIKDYVTRQPAHKIYRVTGGKEKFVTKIDGATSVKRRSYALSTDFGWSDLYNQVKQYQDFENLGISEGRGAFLDHHSDVRDSDQTLSYRIEADINKYGDDCGPARHWESNITADGDGDGKMDFIPDHEYSKLFGKYYGWMIPVITMNLF